MTFGKLFLMQFFSQYMMMEQSTPLKKHESKQA